MTVVHVFTRHRKGCPKRDPGWKRCACPKFLHWSDGKLHRLAAGTTQWDEAYTTARRMEEQFHNGNSNGSSNGSPITAPKTVTVAEAVKAFLADKKSQHLAPVTLQKLTHWFQKQLVGWCEKNNVHSITELDLRRLREWRGTWEDCDLTKQKKQERVRGFFNFCQSEGWIKDNPAHRLSRIKVMPRPTDYFTEAEMDKILEAADEKLKALVLLMRWSGLAIRDAVTLERSRLSEHDQILLYRAKTGVPVFVTLPPDVAHTLRQVGNSNPRYFFWTGNGSPKSVVSMWQRSFHRLFKKLDLRYEDGTSKRAYPHMLRDTFAVNCLLGGVPMHDVAILLGHSSIKTTERYYSPFTLSRQEQLTELVRQTWNSQADGTELRTVEEI